MPKVTVAIATYNREQYLKDCLISIQNQTYQDFEIIIFDNGSNYDLRNLISQFPTLNISLQRVESNIGQDANFVRVYTHSYKTPYVLFFHDDDTMHPRLLEEEVKALDDNSNAAWVGTSFKFVKSDGPMLKFRNIDVSNKLRAYDVAGLVRQILKGFPLCFDSIMYRSGTFGHHMHLVERFSKWSDRPQVITWAGNREILIINAPLVNFRLHSGQDSARQIDSDKYIFFAKELYNFYKSRLSNPLSEKDRKLWYVHTTNHLVSFAAQNTHRFRGFFALLHSFYPEFFKWQYLRPKGFYYILKSILK